MRLVHFAQVVLGWGNARGWGRAAVMPDPVRRQRHRRAVVPSHGPVARDQRRTLVAVGIHSPLATRHSPLATRHLPYPTPSSATRNWVRFACMTCYEMLRFAGFLKLWRPVFFFSQVIDG